jgi:hypothetical protein
MRRNAVKATVLSICIVTALVISVPASGRAETGSSLPIRRFALIVGSNDGGKERIRLQYASSDADSFSRVMMEMGGVEKTDCIVLLNPGYASFSEGMSTMKSMMARVDAHQERREFLFYYSGHSDEEGLLLGQTQYSYRRLREDIVGLPAEVHIAILDSCSSGAMTRSKGGVRKPAFLLDASNVMEGHAFLTSSSADEAAQESDSIRASFFTHYLVSGLRGAADSTGDGRVTLNEAYHYAFNETLASTEKTRYGAQHPTYDISLTGTGDIVLTDLRENSAGLTVSGEINGRLFVRDGYGSLVVELNKTHGKPIELGLKPGSYDITLYNPEGIYRGRVTVQDGVRASLSAADLNRVEEELTVSRGDGASNGDLDIVQTEEQYVTQFFHLGVLPGLSYPRPEERNTLHRLSFNILWGETQRVEGFELGLVGNTVREDLLGLQVAGISNIVRGDVYGAQFGGIASYTRGDSLGFQFGGIAAVTWETVVGVQIAGITGITDHVGGAQISAVNIGNSVRGAQIGLVNVARSVEGTQIGVINISREVEGEAVGLLTISRDGRRHFELWGDTTGFTHLGYRMGTEHIYTLYTLAYNPFSEPARWSYGIGLGGEVPMERFFINFDATLHDHHQGFNQWYDNGKPSLIPEARALAGYSFARRLGVYAGGSVQFFIPGMYSQNTMSGYVRDGSKTDSFFIQWTILAGIRF